MKKYGVTCLSFLFHYSVSFGFVFLLTGPPVYDAVVLLEPANNASSIMRNPSFEWSGVNDSEIEKYEIQISTDSGFNNVVDQDVVLLPRYVPVYELPPNDDYWWRVRAIDQNDGYSSWSETRKYTVNACDVIYNVPAGATAAEIQALINAAIADARTAEVQFAANTTYSVAPRTVIKAINCGGSSYTAIDGTVYEADSASYYTDGGHTYSTSDSIANTDDDTLYKSERWEHGNLYCNIPVPNGTYSVTLKFAEIFNTTTNSRVFDINIEGSPVDNLDLFKAAGHDGAYDLTACSVTVDDGVLNIDLSGVVGHPKLSAILVYQPTYLMGVRNAANLFINGQNCMIQFTDRDAQFAGVWDSSNITIRNFRIDNDRLNFTQGTITSVNTNENTFVCVFDEGYPDMNTDPYLNEKKDGVFIAKGTVNNPDYPGRYQVGSYNLYHFRSKTKIADRTYTIELSDNFNKIHSLNKQGVNDRLVIYRKGARMMDIRRSHTVTLCKIRSYASTGVFCFPGSGSEYVSILNCEILPAWGREMANIGGGFMVSGGRSAFWFEGNEFAGLTDDPINFQQRRIPIVEKLNNNTLLLEDIIGGKSICVGDMLNLADPLTGAVISTPVVTNKSLVSGRNWSVGFDRDVGTVVEGSGSTATMVHNMDCAAELSCIRNNIFRDCSSKGILFRGRGSVIENNRFEGLLFPAILIENFLHTNAFFTEGFEGRDITIKSNTIIKCGHSDLFSPYGSSVRIRYHRLGGISDTQGFSSIRILDNTILDWDGRAIDLGAISNVTIAGNQISNSDGYDSFLRTGEDDVHYAIYAEKCVGMELRDNDITDSRAMTAIYKIQDCSIIYQDDFEGAAGVESITNSVPEVGSAITSYWFSFGNGPDGKGKAFRTGDVNWMSVTFPDSMETDETIIVTAVLGTTSSNSIDFGLADEAGNLVASKGAAPRFRLDNSGGVTAYGGLQMANPLPRVADVFTPGDELTVEMTFNYSTAEMSLYVDGTTVYDDVTLTSSDSTFGLNFLTFSMGEVYNTTTGAGQYIESLKIEVIP